VVEEASDITAIEASGRFRGRYHVLGGHLSPLDGVGPDELNIAGLLQRLQPGVTELIVATNPSVEGEATAAYLHRAISGLPGLRVTRLARGLPVGGDLEYADGVTIAEAFSGRREM
jgi:recombination protein RecR